MAVTLNLKPVFCCLLLISATSAVAVNFPDSVETFIFSDGEPRGGRQAELESSNRWRAAPCPGGANWCEEATDYPGLITIEEQVAAVDFIRSRIFSEERPKNLVFDAQSKIAGRFGGDDSGFVQESRACDHRKSTVYPKKARNVDGAFVFIVNDEDYKQAVDIEQCLGEGESCRNQDDAPSYGETVCRQKYTTYKMYVINEQGEQVYDTFSLPSACLCHHRSDFAIRHSLLASAPVDLPQCPKAEKLSLPRGTNIQPESFAHSFSSSTKQPSPSTENPDISFSSSSSSSSTAKAGAPTKKAGSMEEEIQKPETSSASSAIRFGDRRRKKRQTVDSERRKRQLATEEEEACSNNFCEDEQNYPGNTVLSALTEHPAMSDGLFQQLFDTQCKDEIQTRIFNIDEEQLCYGRPNVIFPKKAKNLNDEWVWVVNIDNYTQSVEVEECDNATLSEDFGRDRHDERDFGVCLYSGAGGNDPDLTVCRQLYTEHKLLSLTADGQLEVDSFKLPSACACFVREDFMLEFRDAMKDSDGAEALEVGGDATPLPHQVEEGTDGAFVFSGK